VIARRLDPGVRYDKRARGHGRNIANNLLGRVRYVHNDSLRFHAPHHDTPCGARRANQVVKSPPLCDAPHAEKNEHTQTKANNNNKKKV